MVSDKRSSVVHRQDCWLHEAQGGDGVIMKVQKLNKFKICKQKGETMKWKIL